MPISPSTNLPLRKGTTKSKGRKNLTDKFYTSPVTAGECLKHLDLNKYSLIIEPSAGSGAFSNQIPNCVALDIKPEHTNIIKQDFFHYRPLQVTGKILVVGNPPFGVQNNLAINFFNHSATFADTIAFVLPLSFKKESIKNKLDLNFSLAFEEVLPFNSFVFEGEPYHVPCVFQIWEKTTQPRSKQDKIEPKSIVFTSTLQESDLFFQRIGGSAGKIGKSNTVSARSKQSNYFMKIENPQLREQIYEFLLTYSWDTVRNHTVGPKSISKQELLKVLKEKFSQI